MPEVILPCTHCRTDRYLSVQSFKALKFMLFRVICNGCGVSGPAGDTRKSAIEAHNALPRALRWTNEPPKVAGDCYVRMRSDESGQWKKPFVEHFSEGYLNELKATPLMQFAGPIPAPVEEKP